MAPITNILFPVDFSASCVAMAPYVKREATLFGAKVSLMYVFDPASHNGFELYLMRGGSRRRTSDDRSRQTQFLPPSGVSPLPKPKNCRCRRRRNTDR